MKTTIQFKQIVTATSFAVAVMFGAPVATHYINVSGLDMISQAHAEDEGGSKQKGKPAGKGNKGGAGNDSGNSKKDVILKGKGDENRDPLSDRPAWAGVKGGKGGGGGQPAGAGSKKGDLYGDLFVVLRDPVTGLPVPNSLGQVQPLDANGNLIPLNADGSPVDPSLTVAVEFSRLSVSRSPSKVAAKSLAEVTTKLAAALTSAVTYDVAGRLVIDGKTVDSPLENLALYQAILKAGGSLTLPTSNGTITLTLANAASFLGAAADKAGSITLDTVMYLDPVLGVPGAFPSTTFSFNPAIYNTTVWVGTVSGSTVTWTATTLAAAAGLPAQTAVTGAIDFAAAADAARAVIQFVHDAPLISYTDPMAP
jgi:hypothetical protein